MFHNLTGYWGLDLWEAYIPRAVCHFTSLVSWWLSWAMTAFRLCYAHTPPASSGLTMHTASSVVPAEVIGNVTLMWLRISAYWLCSTFSNSQYSSVVLTSRRIKSTLELNALNINVIWWVRIYGDLLCRMSSNCRPSNFGSIFENYWMICWRRRQRSFSTGMLLLKLLVWKRQQQKQHDIPSQSPQW